MLCDLCGDVAMEIWESGKHRICTWCKTKLQDNIGMKCLNCGAYGFIPVNEANINRVMFFIPMTQAEVVSGDLVVVYESCPHCGGIEKCKDAVRSVLGS